MNLGVVSLLLFAWTARAAVAQPLPDRQPIVGRALDSEGRPLAGVVISIRRQNKNGSYAFWGATTATGERGEFRFPHAETGRYFLDAAREGFAPLANQPLIWNRSSEPLQLRLGRLVTLQLRVSRPDGALVAKTPLWLRLSPMGSAAQTTRRALSDADGRVRFEGLTPATYALFLSSAEGFSLQNEVNLRGDVFLDIALQRGGSIRASVQQDGAPMRAVGGAVLSLIPENSTPANRDAAILATQGKRVALVSRDGDGTIALSNVPPGRYVALVSLAGYRIDPQPVEIVAGQNRDLLWILPAKAAASLTLQLRYSQSGHSVSGEIALRFLPIKADGTLAADEPSGEIGWTPDAARERRALADKDGKVTIFPLRAGRYRVFAAPRAAGLASENDPAEAASVDVMVSPSGATASLTLQKSSP